MSNAGVSGQNALEKQQFENQTGGWVGVVIIDAQGKPQGVSIEPHGRVWLSEAEKRLTAEAPRNDSHNPFVEQPFHFIDTDTGQRVTKHIAPLVAVSDARFVPSSNRYVPPNVAGDAQTATDAATAQAAATAEEPETPVRTDVETPRATAERKIVDDDESPLPPRRAAAAAAAAEETAGEEEEAAAEEETGAAVPPAGDPAEGEYAAHEEVGTPTEGEQLPPPYTPASDPER